MEEQGPQGKGLGLDMPTWLNLDDDMSWHTKPGYNQDLAAEFRASFRLIRLANKDKRRAMTLYEEVIERLKPYYDRSTCDEQLLNLAYSLGMACAGAEHPDEAIEYLSDAWDVAGRLQSQDWVAQALIGFLAGGLWHRPGHYTDAYQVYGDALEALQLAQQAGRKSTDVRELDIVMRRAWCALELGQFDTAQEHLDYAYGLRATTEQYAAAEAASMAWLAAELARVTENYAGALNLATSAVDMFHELDRTLDEGRCSIIRAECALEIAEVLRAEKPQAEVRQPNGVDLGSYSLVEMLVRARDACERAARLTGRAGDVVGPLMAEITLLQVDRIAQRRQGDEGVQKARDLLRQAEATNEVSLIGRAMTALGDELAATGDIAEAKQTYERAINYLMEYQLGGLASRARRSLERLKG